MKQINVLYSFAFERSLLVMKNGIEIFSNSFGALKIYSNKYSPKVLLQRSPNLAAILCQINCSVNCLVWSSFKQYFTEYINLIA